MKQLTNKQYEEYRQFKDLQLKGLPLTPNGVRFICEACDFDAEQIGQYFLDLLPTIFPSPLTRADPEELSPIVMSLDSSDNEKGPSQNETICGDPSFISISWFSYNGSIHKWHITIKRKTQMDYQKAPMS